MQNKPLEEDPRWQAYKPAICPRIVYIPPAALENKKMFNKVLCPECEKTGEKSIVYTHGISSTLMGWKPYYDQNGDYHDHDPNKKSEHFTCSKGHIFDIDHTHKCWCGWTRK